MIITEAGNAETAKLKLNPVSVDICLSADAKAQTVINAYIGVELDKALSLDITAKALTTKVDASLKLAIIITDLETIISKDATAADTIEGLTIAQDVTNKSITIKGAPKAEGEYILAAYVATEPKVGAVASVAGLTKSIGTVAADKYVLATTVLKIEKTEQQKIDEAIQKSAVSADLAA